MAIAAFPNTDENSPLVPVFGKKACLIESEFVGTVLVESLLLTDELPLIDSEE